MPNFRRPAAISATPATAQIGHVLLEGDANDADFRAFDRPLRHDQQLDEALRDKRTHAIIDASAGEDDLRIIARGLGPSGQAIGIDADAVTADQARGEPQEFHFAPAACKTSLVGMPSRSKMIASSFISAMLRSRWVFSMTFAASATSIEEEGTVLPTSV